MSNLSAAAAYGGGAHVWNTYSDKCNNLAAKGSDRLVTGAYEHMASILLLSDANGNIHWRQSW